VKEMESAIVVQQLGKQFRRYHPDRPWTFQEAIVRGVRRLFPEGRFWALRGASFEVERGKMVGIIGANGAGKSTLLRLVGGVYKPDEGSVQIRGRVGALLDLGTGFHPDLTGRENILINGVISGLTRKEVFEQYESIIDFAELKDFIDNPLRTYSTGMQLRLAFAVATHIQPEILLIDEVLAVGDIAFQQKCLRRINEFKAQCCTILLVSHDPGVIRRMCDEVIWLRSGQVASHGPAEIVTAQYVDEMRAETARRTPKDRPARRIAPGVELQPGRNRLGSFEMEITDVHLLNRGGLPVEEIDSGDPLRVELEYRAPAPIENPVFLVTLTKEDGFVCHESSTQASGMILPVLQGKGKLSLQYERMDLAGGRYYVEVGVYPSNWEFTYDYHWHVYPFNVRATSNEKGVFSPPHHWELRD